MKIHNSIKLENYGVKEIIWHSDYILVKIVEVLFSLV